jgi:transposase-like protein
MADLRNCGVRDILIACCAGLQGFENAFNAAFPATVVQTCVVDLIRKALRPVARRGAKELKKVYNAVDPDAAQEVPGRVRLAPRLGCR